MMRRACSVKTMKRDGWAAALALLFLMRKP
jgi:hypothetical protein